MSEPGRGPDGELEGAGGLRLRYRRWLGPEVRGVVMVIHGLAEHSRRYEWLGEELSAAGFATFALDHRGHGASEGRRGHVHRFDRFLEDVDRFRREVEGSVPEHAPRFLLGHSMGGLIGLRYLQVYDPPLRGAVITSPWIGTVGVSRLQQVAAAVLDRVAPGLPLPSGLDPEDLSHDPERVADYRDDPLIFSTLTPRLWSEIQRATEQVERDAARLRLPLLFLIAGDDRIVDGARSTALARSIRGPDVTVRVLDGYYHEVLQETGRAAVLAAIRGWLEARVD